MQHLVGGQCDSMHGMGGGGLMSQFAEKISCLHVERGSTHVERAYFHLILHANAILDNEKNWVWLKVWLSWQSKSH